MKLKKYLFLLIFLSLVLTPFFVFALELTYPSFPGVTPPQEGTPAGEALPLFVKYFSAFGVYRGIHNPAFFGYRRHKIFNVFGQC